MPLAGYLPTRTFELAVQSLDLTRALRLDIPDALRPAIAASCELAGRLAGQLPTAPELLGDGLSRMVQQQTPQC
jgi:hypothetical protein